MGLLFCDSWDNYSVLTDFWDGTGTDCTIRLNTGKARTGIGCLQINSAAFGPQKNFNHLNDVLICTAWFSSNAGQVFRFLQTDNLGPNVSAVVNSDGSITFNNGNLPIFLGQTVAGLVQFNTYVSIAVRVKNFTAATGELTCWVNGAQVFHQTGLNTAYDPAHPYCNAIQLMGPGGIPTCYHDDTYVLDCSFAPNNTFLGALRLYALPPTGNASPLQWTPLAGTNWSEVSEVPPDGDTSYVSSSTVGQIDQYTYPLTGVPVGASLIFLQHDLDMEVDSGSRSVASDVAGIPAPTSTALSSNYHIYPTPYDTNPSTGVQFVTADFPLNAGPKVTL